MTKQQWRSPTTLHGQRQRTLIRHHGRHRLMPLFPWTAQKLLQPHSLTWRPRRRLRSLETRCQPQPPLLRRPSTFQFLAATQVTTTRPQLTREVMTCGRGAGCVASLGVHGADQANSNGSVTQADSLVGEFRCAYVDRRQIAVAPSVKKPAFLDVTRWMWSWTRFGSYKGVAPLLLRALPS